MSDIPEWIEALERFRALLSSKGNPAKLYWVFREDVCVKRQATMLVRWPLPLANESLAESVFEAGRTEGLVSISAVGRLGDCVVATVWYPRVPNEKVQGWNRGLKLEISTPLATATRVPHFIWTFFEHTPWYRRYQEHAVFIGTRKWATA
ncbi:MAG: hypothetical protein ACLQOO_12395 [Terriglobia bacterium]